MKLSVNKQHFSLLVVPVLNWSLVFFKDLSFTAELKKWLLSHQARPILTYQPDLQIIVMYGCECFFCRYLHLMWCLYILSMNWPQLSSGILPTVHVIVTGLIITIQFYFCVCSLIPNLVNSFQKCDGIMVDCGWVCMLHA